MNQYFDPLWSSVAAVAGGIVTAIFGAIINKKQIVEDVGKKAAERIEHEVKIMSELYEKNRERLIEIHEEEIQKFKQIIAENEADCEKRIQRISSRVESLKREIEILKNKTK